MSNNKRENRLKMTLDIAAIVLSIAAIVVSIISFGYTVYKDIKDERELVNIYLDKLGNDEIVCYDSAGGFRGQGIIDGVCYSVMISNNSKQKISIVSDYLYQKVGDSKVISGILVEQVRDQLGNPVELPIMLEAGESISLTYEINTTIPSHVNMLIMEKYGVEAKIPYEELQRFLGENGRDIFGNEIEYTKYADGTYLIKGEDMEFPIYGLDLITAKGNVFQGVIAR